MSVRYGKEDCKHDWVYRKDGYEEGCCPAICRKCGAFGCACDSWGVKKKYFFDNAIKSTDNIGGKWENPYVKPPDKTNG